MERVHSGGAKFDYEKAKWFNHEWIKRSEVADLRVEVKSLLEGKGIAVNDDSFLDQVIGLVKDRCTLLTDFYDQSHFFFAAPQQIDTASVLPKWNEGKKKFFDSFIEELNATPDWQSAFIEDGFKKLAALAAIKPGELLMPLRIMLVGGKFGPAVFDIAQILGKEETIKRIRFALTLLG